MRRPREGGDPEYLLAFTRHILFVDSFGQQTRWTPSLLSFVSEIISQGAPAPGQIPPWTEVAGRLPGHFILRHGRFCFCTFMKCDPMTSVSDWVPAFGEQWRSFPSCCSFSSSPRYQLWWAAIQVLQTLCYLLFLSMSSYRASFGLTLPLGLILSFVLLNS